MRSESQGELEQLSARSTRLRGTSGGHLRPGKGAFGLIFKAGSFVVSGGRWFSFASPFMGGKEEVFLLRFSYLRVQLMKVVLSLLRMLA